MNNNNAFISFIGARGSGKTTVADQVDVQLTQQGYTVLRQHQGLVKRFSPRSIANAMYLWLFFDSEMIRQIGFCGRTKRRMPSLYRLYLPMAFAHDISRLYKKKTDVLIYDSNVLRGMMQAVLNGDIEPESVVDLYRRKIIPQVGRVILAVVETDSSVSVQRWISRDEVEISQDEINQAIAEREEFWTAARKVIDALGHIPEVTIVELDGYNDPSENAHRVVASSIRISK